MTAHRNFFNSASKAVKVYQIDFARSIMLLEEKIKQHNAQAQSAGVKIKAVHQSLAEKLIRLFRRHFETWQANNGFVYDPAIMPLPTLSVNNEFLAEIMTCTGRTIRNYRDRLERLDLITMTILHGSNANFELVLNPEFLWLRCGSDPQRLQPQVRIFPHTSSCTLPEPLPELVQELVCGKNSTQAGTDVENPSVGQRPHQDANAPSVEQKPEQPEQPEPNNRNESSGSAARTAPPSCAAPPSAVHRQAARLLCTWALTHLWPRQAFNVTQKLNTERQIERLMSPVSAKNIPTLTEIYLGRCQLASVFWVQETGTPLPAPWEFFSPDNPRGFLLTRSWWDRRESMLASVPPSPPPVLKHLNSDGRIKGETQIGNLFTQFKKQ